MKKFLLIAVLAVFGLTANAQVFVGGGVGAQYNSYSLNGGGTYDYSAFTLQPEVGYQFGKWALGLRLCIASTKEGSNDAVTTAGFETFGLYNFVNSGKLHFGAEAAVGYQTLGDGNGSEVTVAFRPVFTVDLSKKASIYASTDLLDFASNSDQDYTRFGFGVLSGCSAATIGFLVKF